MMKIDCSQKIAVVIGTRPEIIKMQPIIKELENRQPTVKQYLVHTGQHYDWNLSQVFIDELDLPKPDVFLNVKSGSHAVQTARTIVRCEEFFQKIKPNIVLVEGDTNSALGASLAAAKLRIPIGHIEAGCRSFDKNMPEEINRLLITDLATLHFAPTRTCFQNLVREGIGKEYIFLTGHPIVDVLDYMKNRLSRKIIKKFNLKSRDYYFVTIHRAENVDERVILEDLLKALCRLADNNKVIFPIHPRTSKSINRFRLKKYLKNVIVVEPVKYSDSLGLIKHAKIVLTDSGGIQQEATLLHTPCITLRQMTEWVETVKFGVNFLARSYKKILSMCSMIEDNYEQIMRKFKLINGVFGRPGVSKKIVDIIVKFINAKKEGSE